MKNLFCLLTLFILSASSLSGQELFKPDFYCTFTGEQIDEPIYTFQSAKEAKDAIDLVMRYIGLEPNFVIMAANVPNASAQILGSERYILYNQLFMREITKKTNTDWAKMSILAHEIGHHLQGHTLKPGGSRPNLELEADHFSGFTLQKMNATIDESLAAIRALANDQGSSTHPGKKARIAAITNGWIKANELQKEVEKREVLIREEEIAREKELARRRRAWEKYDRDEREYQIRLGEWKRKKSEYDNFNTRIRNTKTVNAVGGGGGRSPFSSYTIGPGEHITEVYGQAGTYIDNIGFRYVDTNGVEHDTGYLCGGQGGSYFSYALEPNDRLTALHVRHGKVVDSIVLHTRNGYSPKFGGGGGKNRSTLHINDCEIVGFYGKSGNVVDKIGVRARLINDGLLDAGDRPVRQFNKPN